MTQAPVLLFTYNRPSHTQKTLEALMNNEQCNTTELFVFSDGFSDNSDKNEVLSVRRLIHSINGFKNIHIIERPHNIGLASNVIEGVSNIVNEYGKVIVLEDDLITSPRFLTFMNDALDQFENEEKIGHVHGYCYPLEDIPDVFFIKWVGSWGWGTWKRAWQHFNPDGEALLQEIKSRKLSREFDFNNKYPYTRMLKRQVKGENDSWAIRWNASLFLKDMLSLNAGKSLIQNIGFDGSGVHSGSDEIYTTHLHKGNLNIDIADVHEDKTVRKAFEQYYGRTNSFLAKAKRRINRIQRTVGS